MRRWIRNLAKVLGKTAARHTSREFVEFLTEMVEPAPAREVNIIPDNLSADRSQVVRDFLATHLNVHLHWPDPMLTTWLYAELHSVILGGKLGHQAAGFQRFRQPVRSHA